MLPSLQMPRRPAREQPTARDRNTQAPHQLSLDHWANEQSTKRPEHKRVVAHAGNRPDRPAAQANGASQHHPAVADLLSTPEALLTRTDLRQLGLERRAIDAIFRALPVVALPGYSRPMIHAEDYRNLIECNTYRGDRVRPCRA